mmetsp:Transcript_1707/g.4505  ORF Transcript_1707/g.4505 Transcript_1707/m.4505 type:complete len:281 (+) Transcript_1707:2206-3048(+)
MSYKESGKIASTIINTSSQHSTDSIRRHCFREKAAKLINWYCILHHMKLLTLSGENIRVYGVSLHEMLSEELGFISCPHFFHYRTSTSTDAKSLFRCLRAFFRCLRLRMRCFFRSASVNNVNLVGDELGDELGEMLGASVTAAAAAAGTTSDEPDELDSELLPLLETALGTSEGAEVKLVGDAEILSVGTTEGTPDGIALGLTVGVLATGDDVGDEANVGADVFLGPFPAFPFFSDFESFPDLFDLLDFVWTGAAVGGKVGTTIPEGAALTDGAADKVGC